MTLIVEDGNGLADAESYASLATASAYATAHGLTFAITGNDEALAEQALRRATVWLDARYRRYFQGYRTKYRDQALEWPRTGSNDNGAAPQPIDKNEIPIEIINATIEAAVREKASPGSLSPDVTPGTVPKQITAGSVSIENFNPGGVAAQRPVSTVIDDILVSLLDMNQTGSIELLRV